MMLFSLFNVAMHAKKYAGAHRPRLCYDTEQKNSVAYKWLGIIGDKYGDVSEGI